MRDHIYKTGSNQFYMDQQRISYLLERELEGTLTADEFRELEELKVREDNDLLVNTMADLMAREASHPRYISDEAEDAAFERIISIDAVQEYRTTSPRIHFLRSNWMRVAAAVVLMLGTGAFLLSRKISPEKPVALRQQNIQPNNKVMLTLADGATITLDSAGNQVIRQGNVAVHQHNGQLEYTLEGNETNLSYNTLTVPCGMQYKLTLPDGSIVWLNAASKLRYPTAFVGKERVVELDGQGYFEITQQVNQPFKVKANGVEVKVLGTHFDVMAYHDEGSINTTLLEGAVNIVKGGQQQRLKPGQQAVLDNKTDQLSVQQADIDMVSAWRTGFFELDGTDLPTILRQLARWYDVDIVYKVNIRSEALSGRISRDLRLPDVLQALAGNEVQFSVQGRQIIVLPR